MVKNKYMLIFLFSVIFIHLPLHSFAMKDEENEEYIIPNKVLLNGENWVDEVSDQDQTGTCTSHAVSDCLKYIHQNGRICPFYLHKAAHWHYGHAPSYKDYTKGFYIKELMEFARDYGVPEPQEREIVFPYSGRPFPSGTTKYAFESIYNVYDMDNDKKENFKVKKIKKCLVKYKHPIVIDVTTNSGGVNFFEKYAHPLDDDPDPDLTKDILSRSQIKDASGHAVTVYGYSDAKNGFLIKNSWGRDWLSYGKGVLDYEFVEKLGWWAYIGLGEKYIEGDYIHPFGHAYGKTNVEWFMKGLGTGGGIIGGGVVLAGALPALPALGILAVGGALGASASYGAKTLFWDYINYGTLQDKIFQ